jgi:hypothetical protein
MSKVRLTNRKLFAGLGVCGLLGVLAIALLLGSGSSGASDVPTPASSSSFSVLKPVSSSARKSVADKAQAWLAEMEGPTLANPDGEPLSGLGSVSTQVGEVVVADFGQNVCAYMSTYGVSTCGSIKLSEEGNLLLIMPGCDQDVVVGVLPDGFDSVQAAAAAGASKDAAQSIPVTSNVYAAELEPGETVLTGKSDSGDSFTSTAPLGQIRDSPTGSAACS